MFLTELLPTKGMYWDLYIYNIIIIIIIIIVIIIIYTAKSPLSIPNYLIFYGGVHIIPGAFSG